MKRDVLSTAPRRFLHSLKTLLTVIFTVLSLEIGARQFPGPRILATSSFHAPEINAGVKEPRASYIYVGTFLLLMSRSLVRFNLRSIPSFTHLPAHSPPQLFTRRPSPHVKAQAPISMSYTHTQRKTLFIENNGY